MQIYEINREKEFLHSRLFRLEPRISGDKAYLLNLDSIVLPVYCHMANDLGSCRRGGWTLVMKIDGTKVYWY